MKAIKVTIMAVAAVLIVALALPVGTTHAGTTYVVTRTTDIPFDEVCDADCSLREAIWYANGFGGADTIIVPAGTYTLDVVGAGEENNETGDLDITDEVTIIGDGAATTIIDGNGATLGDRVVQITGAFSVILSGITIRNGNTAGDGGGIYSVGTLILADSAASGNTAANTGAGIFNSGTLTLNNSTVSGNNASNAGSGVYNSGTLILNGSTVSNNGTGSDSGGIYNNGTATLTDSTIRENLGLDGAGMSNSGTMSLVGSTVIDNFGYFGGGISNNGTLTVDGSLLAGNTVVGNGGGLLNFAPGSATLSNSTVSGNSAGAAGGNVFGGGGIYNSANLTLHSSTISGNSAPAGNGGGIASPAGYAYVGNTIIANNPSGGNCAGGAPASQGYNLSRDNSCALSQTGDINNTNPLLGPLANNGGPTRTHALLSESPAAEAGMFAFLTFGCLSTDQRGVSRPQGLRCDIGAYEADDSDGDGVPNPLDDDDDGDTVPDTLDSCRLVAEDLDGFEDSDGCADADNDLDGICDPGLTAISCTGQDAGFKEFYAPGHDHLPRSFDCRNMTEDFDAFKDSDGCPEPDNDNDTFPDLADDCPGTDAVTGPDGALGVGADWNHNGRNVNPTETWPTYPSDGNDDVRYTFEDFDTVLDNDGCHDSPGDDLDQDGFTDEAEALTIGTDPADPCGTDGWPADLSSITFPINSLNRVNLPDLQLYITPVRRLGTSPIVDANYSARFDIVPGPGPFGKYINVADLQKLAFVIPPFYGSAARAFNGPECVYPP